MPMGLGIGLGLSRWPKGARSPEVRAPLLTIACGNSISAQSQWNGSRYQCIGELQIANTLSGAPMRFGRITASTRTDLNGVYGYSGQTLATINSDVAAQWVATVNAGSITPELVIGLALVENDISTGSSTATIISRIQTWISTVQTAWPGAKIILCTPRPNTGYNTGAKVTVYQEISAYILSLDNGSTIYATNLNTYEDPGNAGQPLSGYTSDGTHPNAKGALANARVIGATVRRIVTPVLGTVLGTNTTLTGTTAATGTGISGTKPSPGMSHTGASTITLVSTALQPGWRTDLTINNGDLFYLFPDFATSAIAGAPSLISPYAKVRIVSGGANLAWIQLGPRIQDGGGNTFQEYIQMTSGERAAPGDLVDGDELTFLVPPKAPNSGSITSLANYFSVHSKNGGPFVFDIIEQGYFLP